MDDAHPDEPAAAGDAPSVGALLAEARAAKGRDLEQIARETRVPLRHLMAIEADDHEALPALPYALGFVKSFARSVGLDAESVGAQFRAETRLTPHVPSALSSEPLAEARLPPPGLAWGSLGLLVLLLVGLGLYGAGVFDPAPAPQTVASPEAAPADPAPEPTPAATMADAVPDLPAAGDANAVQPPAASAVASVTGPVNGPVTRRAIPTSGPVVLTAREDVWVRIYDRATGRRAFMGLLTAGQRYEVPADGPPLTLRAGRAGVLQVTVGGVVLPSLGGPVETIDGVVLTASALAARFAPPPASAAAPPAAASSPVQTPDMRLPVQRDPANRQTGA